MFKRLTKITRLTCAFKQFVYFCVFQSVRFQQVSLHNVDYVTRRMCIFAVSCLFSTAYCNFSLLWGETAPFIILEPSSKIFKFFAPCDPQKATRNFYVFGRRGQW